MRRPPARLAILLGLAALIPLSAAQADEACYKKAQSQAELTECSARDLKPVDDRLNKLYKDMEARLKGDDDTKKLLIEAQKKWVAFRDAECALTTIRTAGGSINAMNFNICLTDLTQRRAKDFQSYLDCSKQSADQADDCTIPAAK
jgi:uncharacterized protein YecT (DUF1311 family)